MIGYSEDKLKNAGCEFISGFAFKSTDYTKSGIPLVKIGNIQNRMVDTGTSLDFVSEDILSDKLSKYLLSNKDVLIAMTGQGSVGRVGRLKLKSGERAFLNQRVGKFICDEKNLNLDYLFYILSSEKYQDALFNAGSGSGQPNLSPELILDFEIPIPIYREQTAIAEVLSSLDDKIDLLHRQNKTLEQLAETLFRQWFVEEAERSWDIGKVEDLFILQRGFDLPSQNRTKGAYPIIASNGINGYHDEYKIKGPGVTTGRSGVLGKVIYTQEDFWPLNTTLFVKEYKIATPLFAYFFLKTLDLETLNAGSAVPTLNRNHVHEMATVIPNHKIVIEFEGIVAVNFQKIKSNTQQIHTLTKLRDTLLPKLMSGEVRVDK
jgi:type I restriction enzyme S subunit